MQNAGLYESQTGIKIARRHSNLRYADDTTIMAESKEKLKSLLMRMKEEGERASLKLNINETKIMLSGPIAAAAAAAAKSCQSCPTLCDPIDSSPTGSSVPGILQTRTLEWVAISFSNHESEK